jgi:hypothetical protein
MSCCQLLTEGRRRIREGRREIRKMRVATYLLFAFQTLLPGQIIALAQAAYAAELKFEIGGQTIGVTGDLAGFSFDIQRENIESGVDIATLTWSSPMVAISRPCTKPSIA